MATISKHIPVSSGTIRAWAHANTTQTTVNDSFNLTSLTDTGTGDCTWVWANSFANAFYQGDASNQIVIAAASNTWIVKTMIDTPAAGSLRTVDAFGGNVVSLTYADYVTAINAVGDLA